MLCASRGDHRRLSLLTIFLHIRVMESEVEQSNTRLDIACVLSRAPKHKIFFLLQILVCRKKLAKTQTTLYAARRDCRAAPRPQNHEFSMASPYLDKR